jgi:hypothetical protein
MGQPEDIKCIIVVSNEIYSHKATKCQRPKLRHRECSQEKRGMSFEDKETFVKVEQTTPLRTSKDDVLCCVESFVMGCCLANKQFSWEFYCNTNQILG